jgi:hypothetical protein
MISEDYEANGIGDEDDDEDEELEEDTEDESEEHLSEGIAERGRLMGAGLENLELEIPLLQTVRGGRSGETVSVKDGSSPLRT